MPDGNGNWFRDFTDKAMIKEKFQLFQLMDWMIAFPDALQNRFAEKVKQYQAEKQMPLSGGKANAFTQ